MPIARPMLKRRRDPLFASRRDLVRARADGGVGSPDGMLDKASFQVGDRSSRDE
jgi:hypothetical protein